MEGHKSAVSKMILLGDVSLCSADKTQVFIWNLERFEAEFVIKLEDASATINCILIIENILCTGSSDNLVRVWSTETGQCLANLSGHTGYVNHFDSYQGVFVCLFYY